MAQGKLLLFVTQVLQLQEPVHYQVSLVKTAEDVDLGVVRSHGELVAIGHGPFQRYQFGPGQLAQSEQPDVG